jgi:hypothetical protein
MVDAGPAPWELPTLTWTPCPELGARLECATLEVPADPKTLAGRITLHVTRPRP